MACGCSRQLTPSGPLSAPQVERYKTNSCPTRTQSRRQGSRRMKLFRYSTVVAFARVGLLSPECYTGSDKDRNARQTTSEAIRGPFARGDVAMAMEYHHPDVVKALAFNKRLNGRDAVAADLRLRGTFSREASN